MTNMSKEQLGDLSSIYLTILSTPELLIAYAGTKGPQVSIRAAYEGLWAEYNKIKEELGR